MIERELCVVYFVCSHRHKYPLALELTTSTRMHRDEPQQRQPNEWSASDGDDDSSSTKLYNNILFDLHRQNKTHSFRCCDWM